MASDTNCGEELCRNWGGDMLRQHCRDTGHDPDHAQTGIINAQHAGETR